MKITCLIECKEGIDKLANTFGQKHFSDERRELIFTYVKLIPKEEFDSIIENMLATFRQAPLPKDFEEAATLIRNRLYDENKQEYLNKSEDSKDPECLDCADLGLIEAHENGENFCVHFKCHCIKGEQVHYKIPKWSDKYYGSYTVMQAWPERVKKWIPKEGSSFINLIKEYSARLQISEDYWEYNRSNANEL